MLSFRLQRGDRWYRQAVTTQRARGGESQQGVCVCVCLHLSVYYILVWKVNVSSLSLIEPNVTEAVRNSKKVSSCGQSDSFILKALPSPNPLCFCGSDCRFRSPRWLSLRPAFRSWPLSWGTAAWNWESWAKGRRTRRNFSRSGLETEEITNYNSVNNEVQISTKLHSDIILHVYELMCVLLSFCTGKRASPQAGRSALRRKRETCGTQEPQTEDWISGEAEKGELQTSRGKPP